MSVQTEIDRIINAVDAAHTKVAEKGGTTARPYLVGNLADAIASIPEAKEPVLQPYKTVIPSTSHQSVVPDEGYDGLLEVKVGAVPTAERAKPSLSVNDAGLITATSRQPEGYVEGGVETVTRQLQTTSGGLIIRPGTARKVAAYGSTYITGGNLYVDGDANLKAENIKSGVSIFGVAGSYEGSGGGSGGVETCTLTVLPPDAPMPPGFLFMYVTDGNMKPLKIDVTATGDYIVAKNTLLLCDSRMIVLTGSYYSVSDAETAVHVTGDCSFMYLG